MDTERSSYTADTRSRWGRVKFGGRWSALWLAIPSGLLLACAIATILVLTGSAGPHPLVGWFATVLVSFWACAGLVWALSVDRDSLRGATPRPEQSVESAWIERATSGAFGDTLLVTGLGTAVIAVGNLDIPALLALVAVIVVAMGSVSIRYGLERRRG
ncbi:hypothetical protein [Pseudoclavibacter sp. VKM Ac-2888]|uniref:hypothetical protein n=1 Tax=Pseudoclavibacter sp. VKM Ac-2888 TaxID=2783830 RepID=UPI001889E028|nr:hypothetical protein [Pseudoclavibacter sp. VKM Ac-2888]MBF4551565.1 hypothetical protein [Pseudoclavibacter sp. VKM Ac-2888]